MASVITAIVTARLQAAAAVQLRSCCRVGRPQPGHCPAPGPSPRDYTVRVILGQD